MITRAESRYKAKTSGLSLKRSLEEKLSCNLQGQVKKRMNVQEKGKTREDPPIVRRGRNVVTKG